jgi:hypothetical protein
MAGPAGQQNTTSLSWRVRVCRASWKGLLFVWGTVVIGMSVGTVANLNTTTIRKTGETGTSLTDILSKLFIVLQKRQKTAPTSGSIPGAPEAFQADEIAEHASGTLPMSQVSPKPTQPRVGQRAIVRDPVGETSAFSVRKTAGCSFTEVIRVSPSQIEETGVSRFECPTCKAVRDIQPKGDRVKFPSHPKRTTTTPNHGKRWVRRGSIWERAS